MISRPLLMASYISLAAVGTARAQNVLPLVPDPTTGYPSQILAGETLVNAAGTAYSTGGGGGGGVCTIALAGQITVFNSVSSVCSGVITVPTLEPGSGLYFGAVVETPNASGNLSSGAFVDFSILAATPGFYTTLFGGVTINESPAAGASYNGLWFEYTFNGSDAGGAVVLNGVNSNVNFAGTATGSGSYTNAGYFSTRFSGTGTLEFMTALSAQAFVDSGNVTSIQGVGGTMETDGGNIISGFDFYSQFANNGGTIGMVYAYFDDADSFSGSGTRPTNPHGFYQAFGATNHVNQFIGPVFLPSLTASSLLVTDSTDKVISGVVGAGLNLSAAGSLTNAGVISLTNGLGISITGSLANETISNAGVIALASSTGINLTGTTADPTIVNTGVTSLAATGQATASASTGAVTISVPALVAGTGISISSGNTIVNTTTTPVGANPSATIGTAASNGTATTFLRSDAAPALTSIVAAGTVTNATVTFNTAGQITSASSGTAPLTTAGTNLTVTSANTINFPGTVSAAAGQLFVNSTSNTTAYECFGLVGVGGAAIKFQRWSNSCGTASTAVWGDDNTVTTDTFEIFAGSMNLASGTFLAFNNATFLTEPGAAVLHLGKADAASPVSQTLGVQGATGTNTAGGTLTIQGSLGTGTGASGPILLSTGLVGTTGTTQQSGSVVLKVDNNQHLSAPGASPAVTTCGTGSPSITGSDIAGTVTTGTLATACTITFKVAYSAAPHCTITDQSLLSDLLSYTISTTAIVLTTSSNTGDKVDYICIGA